MIDLSNGIEVDTVLAAKLSDDQEPIDALAAMIKQQGADDVDVLHVISHEGRLIGLWVAASILMPTEIEDAKKDGRWQWRLEEEVTYQWAWMPDSAEQERIGLRATINECREERDKLALFKKNTHLLLDEVGAPQFADEDCRVSARIRWLAARAKEPKVGERWFVVEDGKVLSLKIKEVQGEVFYIGGDGFTLNVGYKRQDMHPTSEAAAASKAVRP